MILSSIVARARNGVIGRQNQLPWHIPSDLKFFHEKTKGHVLLMGRKTFESLGKPLPNRFHIVITRQKDCMSSDPMVRFVPDIKAGIEVAKSLLNQYPAEVFVLGGSEIYAQTMEQIDRLYLTAIDEEYDGDAYFPDIDSRKWKLVENREEKGSPNLAFQTWEPLEKPRLIS